jgi:hypothetical protein
MRNCLILVRDRVELRVSWRCWFRFRHTSWLLSCSKRYSTNAHCSKRHAINSSLFEPAVEWALLINLSSCDVRHYAAVTLTQEIARVYLRHVRVRIGLTDAHVRLWQIRPFINVVHCVLLFETARKRKLFSAHKWFNQITDSGVEPYGAYNSWVLSSIPVFLNRCWVRGPVNSFFYKTRARSQQIYS